MAELPYYDPQQAQKQMGGQQPQIYQAQQMPYQQPQDQGLTFMSFPEDSSAKTGTFGQLHGGSMSHSPSFSSFDDEPPLLEELGINVPLIYKKTMAVARPWRLRSSIGLMEETDLSGPLLFCLLLGGCHMLTGHLFFGYIYGWGCIGVFSIYSVLNLIVGPSHQVDFVKISSVLGYSLLPVVLAAATSPVLRKGSVSLLVISVIGILWATRNAVVLLPALIPGLQQQKALIAYPIALLYTLISLLTIF
mmetsp:Transcript_12059/g.44035  ORF Transcript_12059/g.44035 Transcript_12059/m.44035 type:complete len:248 (-) Transcript_12059:886-1629(-)